MNDLELMYLLEDEGYEPSFENLAILKEGLEIGKYEILGEASSGKKAYGRYLAGKSEGPEDLAKAIRYQNGRMNAVSKKCLMPGVLQKIQHDARRAYINKINVDIAQKNAFPSEDELKIKKMQSEAGNKVEIKVPSRSETAKKHRELIKKSNANYMENSKKYNLDDLKD